MKSNSVHTLQVCLVALCLLVTARIASADSISMLWEPSTDQVAGYKLYVGTQSGIHLQNVDVGEATTFTFTDAVAGQEYCFVVTAYTDPSVESPASNEVCGFSNASPSLANPGDQSSTVGQSISLQLTGTDPASQPLTYSATGLPAGLSLMESTGFIGGSGTIAGTYDVIVTASDGVLSSAQSFTWTISSSTDSPQPPSSVTLSAEAFDRSRRDRVRLAWTTASWAEAWVYRNGGLIAQTDQDGSFTDYIWHASGTYSYVVCAPDAAACSNSVTVDF